MLYNVNISQIALSDLDIDELDFNDLAIFNAIEYACNSRHTIKITISDITYTLITDTFIREQLPCLKHNSKETIKRKLRMLESAGLIEKCSKNEELQKPYYRMGRFYDSYKSRKNQRDEKQNNETPFKNEPPPPSKMNGVPPSNLNTNNNIIDNNNINNNNRVSFKKFLEIYPSNRDEQKAYSVFHNFLNDEEKKKAIEKIPIYLEFLEVSGTQKFLKAPANYLKDKTFNTDWNKEINRIQKYSKEPEPNSRFKEVL